MRGVSEVLLRDLQLDDVRCLRHRAEHRVVRLARHEVQRAVLGLDEDVVAERPVERHELHVRALDAIGIDVRVVDECTPHHDAAVRLHRVRQQVGAVGVRARVVLRSWLPLAVGLDEESAEIRNRRVDLGRLVLPPLSHRWIERIGRRPSADRAGGSEIGGEVDLYSVGAKHVGDGGRLADVLGAERPRVSVDVVEHSAVEAQRSIRARVVVQPPIDPRRQLVPVPQRTARVAALDRSVQVVPVIEQTKLVARLLAHVESIDRRTGREQAQQMKGTVERAAVAGGRDDQRTPAADPRGSDDKPFRSQPPQLRAPAERSHDWRRERADDERAVTGDRRPRWHFVAKQTFEPACQFVRDDGGGRW